MNHLIGTVRLWCLISRISRKKIVNLNTLVPHIAYSILQLIPLSPTSPSATTTTTTILEKIVVVVVVAEAAKMESGVYFHFSSSCSSSYN